MIRPVFPPRPPGAVNIPPISRPPVAGIPTVRPIIPPVVRPMVAPSATPAEKPQNTVYIGKIASTVENEFMLSLLQVNFLSLFFTWVGAGFGYLGQVFLSCNIFRAFSEANFGFEKTLNQLSFVVFFFICPFINTV